MKQITVDDCYELEKEFRTYCETAEQHEFITLVIINSQLGSSVKEFAEESENGIVLDQKTANAMFRVVLRGMGKDFSEYMEA